MKNGMEVGMEKMKQANEVLTMKKMKAKASCLEESISWNLWNLRLVGSKIAISQITATPIEVLILMTISS